MHQNPTSELVVHLASLTDARATEIETTQALPERLLPLPLSRVPKAAKMLTMRDAGWTPQAFDETVYVPARELTVRPAAADYVSIPYPKDVTHDGVWKTVLAIYIDEDGTVARVRVHGAQLPAPFERAALETFGRARFHPGRIGDKPVKCRMLVEVQFANEAGDMSRQPRVAVIPGKP